MECIEIQDRIQEAEMILVGLGEEFNEKRRLSGHLPWQIGRNNLEQANLSWLLPAWQRYCLNRLEDEQGSALRNLASILEGKNYYVVSTATSDRIEQAPFREGRLVMPCGSLQRKQCEDGCAESLCAVTEKDMDKVEEFLTKLYETGVVPEGADELLGVCEKCGKPMVFNTVYTDQYLEAGYLTQWSQYTKWLQGTPNRKLLVLELGVGMQFPSVIRFAFEKVAFYNQKSHYVRINEKLYQLTKELADKGSCLSQNAIDYLNTLC